MEQVLPPPSTVKVFYHFLSIAITSKVFLSFCATFLHIFDPFFLILLNVTKTYAVHFTDMTSLAWLNMHMLVWF